MTLTYTLVAVAFHASISGAPVATLTNVGTYDSGIACFWAAESLAETIESAPTGQFSPRNFKPSPDSRVIFKCLPSEVPPTCAASPAVCRQNEFPTPVANP